MASKKQKNVKMGLMDAQFILNESPDAPQHMAGLFVFKLPPKAGKNYVEKLFWKMRDCPVNRPPFNYLLERSARAPLIPSWKVLPNEDIDIDYHLRRSALPSPGGELELGQLISRLQANPLNFKKPLWEVHIIEGLSDRRFAIYQKLHHSLLDGMASLKIISFWFSPDKSNRSTVPFWSVEATSEAEATSPEYESSSSVIASVANLQKQGLNTVSSLPKLARSLVSDVLPRKASGEDQHRVLPYSAPPSEMNKRITQRRRISTMSLEFKKIKKIAAAADATLNDVITTIIGTAVRNYSCERSSLPDKSLVAGVLASVRAAKKSGATTGNAISFLFADVATEADTVTERMERVKCSISASKKRLFSMDADAIAQYTTSIVAPYGIAQLLRVGHQLPRPLYNFAISNLPGPREKVYFWGAEVEGLYPLTVLNQGQALLFVAMSWVDRINITIIACPDILPNSQKLVDYLQEAQVEVEDAFGL